MKHVPDPGLGPDRETVHEEFAKWYFDLEKGISHLSFLAPWAPTAAHRSRDNARKQLSKLFTPIIRGRRALSAAVAAGSSVAAAPVLTFPLRRFSASPQDEEEDPDDEEVIMKKKMERGTGMNFDPSMLVRDPSGPPLRCAVV